MAMQFLNLYNFLLSDLNLIPNPWGEEKLNFWIFRVFYFNSMKKHKINQHQSIKFEKSQNLKKIIPKGHMYKNHKNMRKHENSHEKKLRN